MTTCVISQPRFFPGLHYLHRMLVCDVFVIFDTVQYNPRHEENRAKVKASEGPQWLTVPMNRNGRDQLIADTAISDQPWQAKAQRTLENLYGNAEHFARHFPEIESILLGDHKMLTDLDVASWQPALDALQPTCEFVRSSELAATGRGGDLLLNICQEVEATAYLSGGFGRDYLDVEPFDAAGIALNFHDFEHPEYSQQFLGFTPYLSYLDALFNIGLDRELVFGSANEPR